MPAVPDREGGIEKEMGRGPVKLSPLYFTV